MKIMKSNRLLAISCFALLIFPALVVASAQKQAKVRRIDFDAEVRPILGENCFSCHGFDTSKRQAGLRLDTPEGLIEKLASGHIAVKGNDLKESALAQRILAHGAGQMPPVSSGKSLTPVQVKTLQQWILQGGKYEKHWAFVKPTRPTIPVVTVPSWSKNPVDRFLLKEMVQHGLKPSVEAPKTTLIRRLTFDLTGLPPTEKEIDAFLADKSSNAYEKVVERLLASPKYGERMALPWLDLSRYADTHGFHIDSHRDMWRWRDWVISAFNQNMSYDEFVTEQLAGDLLPKATIDQKIATGFNRNHPINFEGGAIPEEYAAAYIFDRIDTTATALLGLTLRCAQCHDHKYDPLTQKDFYRFYAFFNSVPEQGLDGQRGNAVPFMKAPTVEQADRLIELKQAVTNLEKAKNDRVTVLKPAMEKWLASTNLRNERFPTVTAGLVAEFPFEGASLTKVTDQSGKFEGKATGDVAVSSGKLGSGLKFSGTGSIELSGGFQFERTDKASYGCWVNIASNESLTALSKIDSDNSFRGWDLYIQNGKVFIHIVNKFPDNCIRINTRSAIKLNEWHHVFATYDGSSKASGLHIYVDGKMADVDVSYDTLTESIKTEKPLSIGKRTHDSFFRGMIDEIRLYNRDLSASEVADIVSVDNVREGLYVDPAKRTPAQTGALADYYYLHNDSDYLKANNTLLTVRKEFNDLDSSIPTTMVMQEMDKPRDTFMLVRGQYDKKGDKVGPAVPAILTSNNREVAPNRLGLAKWIVDPENPLTSRVAVNRLWQMVFGNGLVKTSENFGTQGERPSHPELLDWLALSFQSGIYDSTIAKSKPWDVKNFVRLLVTSSAYKQSSATTPQLIAKDPDNKYLSRSSRMRLPAEMIRDQALALSGLMVEKIGGPSVKPYQPAGLWEDISFKSGDFTAQNFVQDHGENLYRRSMYTFWKRTCPPPGLQILDAPEREFCVVRRGVTNTPLQALVLMNDITYVEASRNMAEKIITSTKGGSIDRVKHAFRIAAGRYPTPSELKVLSGIYSKQFARFTTTPGAAIKFLSVGESMLDKKLDLNETAALAAVCSVIMNLDEVITKG